MAMSHVQISRDVYHMQVLCLFVFFNGCYTNEGLKYYNIGNYTMTYHVT